MYVYKSTGQMLQNDSESRLKIIQNPKIVDYYPNMANVRVENISYKSSYLESFSELQIE